MKANKFIFIFIFVLVLLIILFVPIKPASEDSGQSLFQLAANLAGIEVAPRQTNLTIILAGDVMFGRTVMTTSLDKNDPSYPFRQVASTLQTADLTFVNLESPFISGCQRDYEGLIFCADPSLVSGLVENRINIVSLANNHSRNYGEQGLQETVNLLTSHGISATGLGELVTKEILGVKLGFLGFDFLSQAPRQEDYDLINQSKEKVDLLIVGVHWGVEYSPSPTQAQREWAQAMVDAGADLIVGHHPHVVQEIGNINGRPVYYSLGNFVFDQMWSEKTRQGLIIKLTINKEGKIIKEEPLKTYMHSWAQPELVD